MARQERKFHYIYKITCKVTNKFYVGMHSTDNLNDGYFGSGTRLAYSKRKHGLDNHIKEILEFLTDRESLKARETEIITEDFIKDPLCMNLKPGGYGGFCNETHRQNFYAAGNTAAITRLKELQHNNEWVNWNKQIHKTKWGSIDYRNKMFLIFLNNNPFKNKQHSEETKQLMREKANQRVGNKNSQYGTCWITNELENKKIRKGESIPDGWHLGRKILN